VRHFARFLLLTLPVLASAQSESAARRPWVEPGDCWTYRAFNVFGEGTEVHALCINFINEGTILATSTRKSDGKEIDSTWTRDWHAVSSYTGFIYRLRAGFFQFPLNIGQTFSTKFDVLRPRSDVVLSRVEISSEVSGWEEIEVPAGKFRALKIVSRLVSRRTDGKGESVRTVTFWYQPEVRRWVKFVSEGTNLQTIAEELIDFKLK